MRGRSSQAVITVLVSVCIAAGLGGETSAETGSVPPDGEAAAAAPTAVPAAPSASGASAGRGDAKAGRTADQNDLFQSLALGSGKEPIRIHSDSLELDYKGSTLTYRGNVQVTQGEVTLDSDTLAITFDRSEKPGGAKPGGAKRGDKKAAPTASSTDASDAAAKSDDAAKPVAVPGRGDAGRIKQVIAEGHVKIRQGDRLAEGRRAVFDQAKQTIVLSDGAVLHEGPNKVTGDRIVVYLQEERSVVESGSNSRVQAVFYPGSAGAKDATKTKTGTNAAPSGPVARGDGRSGAAQ